MTWVELSVASDLWSFLHVLKLEHETLRMGSLWRTQKTFHRNQSPSLFCFEYVLAFLVRYQKSAWSELSASFAILIKQQDMRRVL